eukprot:1147645-Pelagomonas_calceolata.AAC.1
MTLIRGEIKQGSESVVNYALKLRKCFILASDLPVTTVCDRFVYGLRPELRGLCAYPVQGGFWQNLDDCITNAIAREQSLNLNPPARVAAPVQPRPKQKALAASGSQQRRAGNSQPSGSPRPTTAIRCNYCKQPGHIIADCKKRKAKEATKGKASKRGPESGAGGASKSQKV